LGKAPVEILGARQVGRRGGDGARVVRAGVEQGLEDRGRVVYVARTAAPGKAVSAVGVLLALEPRCRFADRAVVGRMPRRDERDYRKRG
jgi:hypothetical protein